MFETLQYIAARIIVWDRTQQRNVNSKCNCSKSDFRSQGGKTWKLVIKLSSWEEIEIDHQLILTAHLYLYLYLYLYLDLFWYHHSHHSINQSPSTALCHCQGFLCHFFGIFGHFFGTLSLESFLLHVFGALFGGTFWSSTHLTITVDQQLSIIVKVFCVTFLGNFLDHFLGVLFLNTFWALFCDTFFRLFSLTLFGTLFVALFDHQLISQSESINNSLSLSNFPFIWFSRLTNSFQKNFTDGWIILLERDPSSFSLTRKIGGKMVVKY